MLRNKIGNASINTNSCNYAIFRAKCLADYNTAQEMSRRFSTAKRQHCVALDFDRIPELPHVLILIQTNH